MAESVLYLIRTATPDPLLDPRPNEAESTVVLLEEGVTRREITGLQIYTLGPDADARRVTPKFPVISYAELLDLVFRSDRVVTL